MPAEQRFDPFSGGGRFAANPHLYGYVHTLVFAPAGTVEMVDGAGQGLFTLVRGRFTVEELGPTQCAVDFADLVELDPYYQSKRFRHLDFAAFAKALQGEVPYEEHDVRRRLAPFCIPVSREAGLFVLRCQVIWKIEDEREWPYLLYRVRYRFATDPLAAHLANRRGSLYYASEAPEPDTRVYYRAEDAQRWTAGELGQAGIAGDDQRP